MTYLILAALRNNVETARVLQQGTDEIYEGSKYLISANVAHAVGRCNDV